jgi:hypothetical protein
MITHATLTAFTATAAATLATVVGAHVVSMLNLATVIR